jgi:hypothetical protein
MFTILSISEVVDQWLSGEDGRVALAVSSADGGRGMTTCQLLVSLGSGDNRGSR